MNGKLEPFRKTLTVVIRNPAPFIFMQEPVTHRTVKIELTDAQMGQLSLNEVGETGGETIYEEISQVFFEEDSQ